MALTRLWQRLGRLSRPARLLPPPFPVSAAQALPAYVALGHRSPARRALEGRLELLVAQLAAELSACRWCIDRGRHRWRKALLPRDLLPQLRSFEANPAFTERERAALALVVAVTRHSRLDPAGADQALARARCHFAEPDIARIAAAAAEEHFFDPATGAVGRDVRLAGGGGMPWRAIGAGIRIRGFQ